MIAVIFEVEPREGHAGAYFDLAGELKPLVEGFDGFISVERFEAVLTPGRFLSLSFWRDEEAVRAWRNSGPISPSSTSAAYSYSSCARTI